MGLTRDHIVWAYRILLDRDPENEDVILPKMRGYQNTRDLRNDIVTSEDNQEKNRDYAQMNERNLVIKEIEPGLRLAIDLADHAIGLNILRGRFELNEIEFVRRTVKPGQHVVDAGAHIGLFAMHMAAAVGPSGSVHCFEPFEANAACLELAIAENRFERRVILERAAVGAMHGTGQLIFAPATLNSGGAFIGAPGASVPAGHETLPVRLIALDEYPLPRPISFIKIDVEGAEPQALRGAARLLTGRPARDPLRGAPIAAEARIGDHARGVHRADRGAGLPMPLTGRRRARCRGDRRADQRRGVGRLRAPVSAPAILPVVLPLTPLTSASVTARTLPTCDP